jgi:FG-GAP-like repeat
MALHWIEAHMQPIVRWTLMCGSTLAVAPPQSATLRYERSLLLETTSETSANVSIGDLDGDGRLDLVLAKGRHWPLVDRVLLGDGRGRIRSAHDLGTASDRSYSGSLADLDRDGDLDVVISNDTPDPKLVYLNDGKGRFTVGSTFGRAEWETRNARVADLNGDGLPDIVVANRADKSSMNYVCLNRGKGRFDADCTAFSHEPATTVTPVDTDRDGRVDLVVPHRDGGQSHVYRFGAGASLANPRRIPFGPPDASFRIAEAADFDRDGLLDLVAIDERRGAAIYFGQRDGAYSSGVAVSDGKVTPYALAVADLDGNGAADIVVGHIEAPSSIYVNDGSGRRFNVVRFGDSKGTVYGFAIADLDRDGLPDIAVARSDAPNIVYFADR